MGQAGDETRVLRTGLAEKVREDFKAKGFSAIHENVLRAAGTSLEQIASEVGNCEVTPADKYGVGSLIDLGTEVRPRKGRRFWGELYVDTSGEAHFDCHTSGDIPFDEVRRGLTSFVVLLMQQLERERECPYAPSAVVAPLPATVMRHYLAIPVLVAGVKELGELSREAGECARAVLSRWDSARTGKEDSDGRA